MEFHFNDDDETWKANKSEAIKEENMMKCWNWNVFTSETVVKPSNWNFPQAISYLIFNDINGWRL